MKKINKFKSFCSLTLVLSALLISSCGTDASREDQISTIIGQIKDPILVMNVMPGEIIAKSGALDGALPYTQEMFLGFFIDDSLTGIDNDVDVQIIIGNGSLFMPNFYGIFKLKDEEVFIHLLETEANAKIESKDGFNYMIKENDNYVVVWNSDFAMASTIPMDMSAMMGGGAGNGGKKAVDKLIGYINGVDDDENWNTDYSDFLMNESDLSMHMDGEGLFTYLKAVSMGQVEELNKSKEMIQGLKSNLFLNFNEGDIHMQFVSNLSEEMKGKLTYWDGKEVNRDFLAYGSSSNPIFTLAQSINIADFFDNATGEEAIMDVSQVERELEKMGLTLEDAKQGLNGDLLVVMDRIEVKEEVMDWGYGEPYVDYSSNPIVAIILGVKDESVIKQFMTSIDENGQGIVKNGDAFIAYKNNVLFSSNDSLWAVNFLAGQTVQIVDEQNVFNSDPFAMFLDFKKVASMNDMGQAKELIEMMSYLKGAGNADEFNLYCVLKDGTHNSLRLLTEVISSMTEEGPETEEARDIQEELEAIAEEVE